MFPAFVTDAYAAESYCAAELAAWRREAKEHRIWQLAGRAGVCGAMTRAMRCWTTLAPAFRALRAAYTAAVRLQVAA